MNIWILLVTLGSIVSCTIAFVWVGLKLSGHSQGAKKQDNTPGEAAERDVEHIFNDEFREELRNRGRLHFEKIIGENAMFLQQDLRLTTSQLNEYMKSEITRTLKQEFSKYEESITDATNLAMESLNKTQEVIEQQRQVMTKQLAEELASEKARMIKRFEENMAEIVNHYVMEAIGTQIDLNNQLEFIVGEIQNHKQEILQDIKDVE